MIAIQVQGHPRWRSYKVKIIWGQGQASNDLLHYSSDPKSWLSKVRVRVKGQGHPWSRSFKVKFIQDIPDNVCMKLNPFQISVDLVYGLKILCVQLIIHNCTCDQLLLDLSSTWPSFAMYIQTWPWSSVDLVYAFKTEKSCVCKPHICLHLRSTAFGFRVYSWQRTTYLKIWPWPWVDLDYGLRLLHIQLLMHGCICNQPLWI